MNNKYKFPLPQSLLIFKQDDTVPNATTQFDDLLTKLIHSSSFQKEILIQIIDFLKQNKVQISTSFIQQKIYYKLVNSSFPLSVQFNPYFQLLFLLSIPRNLGYPTYFLKKGLFQTILHHFPNENENLIQICLHFLFNFTSLDSSLVCQIFNFLSFDLIIDFIISFTNPIIQTICCYLLFVRSHFPISSSDRINLIRSLSLLIQSEYLSDNLIAALLHSAANLCHFPSSAKLFETSISFSHIDLLLNNNSREISYECLNFIHRLIHHCFINLNIRPILNYVCDEEEKFSILSLKILKKVVEMNFDENLIHEGLMIKLNELQTKEVPFHQKELVARIYGKILIFGKKEPFEELIDESFMNSCFSFLSFLNEKVLSSLIRGFLHFSSILFRISNCNIFFHSRKSH